MENLSLQHTSLLLAFSLSLDKEPTYDRRTHIIQQFTANAPSSSLDHLPTYACARKRARVYHVFLIVRATERLRGSRRTCLPLDESYTSLRVGGYRGPGHASRDRKPVTAVVNDDNEIAARGPPLTYRRATTTTASNWKRATTAAEAERRRRRRRPPTTTTSSTFSLLRCDDDGREGDRRTKTYLVKKKPRR